MGLVLKCGACGTENTVDAFDPGSPPYCDTCFGVLRPPKESPPEAPAPPSFAPAPVRASEGKPAAAPSPAPDRASLDSLFASADMEPPPAPPAPVAPPPMKAPPPLSPVVGPTADPTAEPADVTAAAAEPRNLFGPAGPDGKPSCVLLGPLGQDATGAVYKAYDRAAGRRFAVRFMAGQAGDKESALLGERVQAIVAIPHPNILAVHGTGKRQNRLYIATDLVEAVPLGAAKVTDPARLIAIFRDAAEAIGYAHGAGIFHGDVNPENILVSKTDDRALVKDFQLAHLLETLSAAAELHNPAFLPPEQAKHSSRHPSAAGDIYGLGATLYTALAGRPPFEAATPAKIFGKIQMEEPPALEKLRPDVPEALAAVVRHAMAKEPALRYPTAKEFAEALVRAAHAPPARKPGPEAVATKPSTRRAEASAPSSAPKGGSPEEWPVETPEPRPAAPAAARPAPAPKPAPAGKKSGWVLPAAALLMLVAGGGGFLAYRSMQGTAPAPTPIPTPTPAPVARPTPAPIEVPPAEDPGMLDLDVQPQPTEIRIDDRPTEIQKTFSLRKGNHRIEIHFGDVREIREVHILPAETAKLKVRAHRAIAAKHEQLGRWTEAEKFYRTALTSAPSGELTEIEERIAHVVRKRMEAESVLRVDSVPPGAAVVVDGKPAGVTPAQVAKLVSGPHTVELKLDGHHPVTQKVEYDPGKTPALRVELRPMTGKVRVLGLRAGDRVKLGDKTLEAREDGPVEFDAVRIGVFEVVVQRAGYNDARGMGRVDLDKTSEVTGLVFSMMPGSLVVESTPAGAEVQMDGRVVGKTPLKIDELPPGAKKIRLVHAERSDWDGEIQVKGGEKAQVKAMLPAMVKLAVAAHPEGTRISGAVTGATRAEAALKAGEHKVKISHPEAGELERVFKLAPGDEVSETVDLWQLRADEQEKAGKLEEAGAAFSKARLEIRDKALPRLAEIWAGRAEESLKAREWAKARQAANQALKVVPTHARSREIVGAVAYEEAIAQAEDAASRNDWTRAKEAAGRALAAKPGDARAGEISRTAAYREAFARGAALQKEARWLEARRAYEQALAALPGDAEATAAIGLLKSLTWSETRFIPGYAFSAAFSPSGKMLACGRFDKMVDLWSLENGQLVRALAGHGGPVSCVAFSPDGKTLISGAADGKVKVWDPSTGKTIETLGGHEGQVWSIAFSPDGTRAASTGDDKTIRLWDASTWREIRSLEGHGASVSSVAFGPDGKRLASAGGDKTIKLWDLETGKEVRSIPGHEGTISQVVFSPDGRRLASAGGDQTIRIWEVESGRELRKVSGHTSHVSQVAFTPDGRLLVSVGGDKLVRLWDAEKGTELRTLAGHTREAWSIALMADGARMVTTGSDGVRLWGLAR